MSVGSSLTVQPAAVLCAIAKEDAKEDGGARLVIVNADPTSTIRSPTR